MIDLIKSYLLPKTTKVQLVDRLQKLAVKDFYSCKYVARLYPEPVQLWYRRQLRRYAKQHKVSSTNVPFSFLALKYNTSKVTQRQAFLKDLYARLL